MATSDYLNQSTPSSSGPSLYATIESNASTSNLLTHVQYAADHVLQSYEVYIPSPPPQTSHTQSPTENPEHNNSDSQVWLICIHGGAWRDPTITATGFLAPTLSHLLSSPSQPISIVGYISLSYRLSPHPSHPQPPPPAPPPSSLRNAMHPDHITDILLALRFLQRRYAFGNRYLLAGHSCGGTMAWQVAMSRTTWARDDFEDVSPPLAIVSLCAIYDLPLLVSTYKDVRAYREFVVAAFGEEEEAWERVSPARWRDYNLTWDGSGGGGSDSQRGELVAVLAHSRADELVDWAQVEGMQRCLQMQQRRKRNRQEREREQEPEQEGKHAHGGWEGDIRVLEIEGTHEEVWQKGEEMARAIRLALEMLS